MTDWYHRPDYSVTGPDVTWLYVHYLPPFAAYVLDYLFTDAEARSNGAVSLDLKPLGIAALTLEGVKD